jgi:signal transduction histidine kinase
MMAQLTDLPWRDMFARIPLGVMVLDLKAEQIAFCNPAMERILVSVRPLNYPRIKEIFLHAAQPAFNDDPVRQAVVLDEKKIGFTVYAPDPDSCLLLANDVSEKTRQEQIAATTDLMSTIDYTFFNLAHELGNPINSIKMTLEVLINNFNKYTTTTKLEYLGNLYSEFSRMEELLKAIKSFNMFEHLTSKATDIHALLDHLLLLLKSEITSKHISVKVRYPEQPVFCLSDPRALHQSLFNIISNAIAALEGKADAVIAVEVGLAGHEAAIKILDNGCGIPDEKKKELFMPFSSSKPRGVGLGLTIVKKLLAQMNGTVEIKSLRHQGTEVLIRLPLASET